MIVSLDERVDLAIVGVVVLGGHLDLDLADRLGVEPGVEQLLQQPVAVGDARRLNRDVLRP